MKKILIIEDNNDLRINLTEFFENNNFIAISASGGLEGIDLAKREKPDIILSDIMMPGIDGYEVKNELSADPETSLIPFIFLSAKNEINEFRKGMDLGADDYISKPFNPEELLGAIENRLRRIETFVSKGERNNNGTDNDLLNKTKNSVLVKLKDGIKIIKLNKINVITSVGNYSAVFNLEGERILVHRLLKQWENILPVKNFFRASRSAIINMDHVISIKLCSSRTYCVKLKGFDGNVIISQRNSRKLKSALQI